MARSGDYKALILTSDPETIAEVTEIAERNFENVSVLFWEMGNMSTKPDAIHSVIPVAAADARESVTSFGGRALEGLHAVIVY